MAQGRFLLPWIWPTLATSTPTDKCRAAASVKEDNKRRRSNKHYRGLRMGSKNRIWDRTFQPSNTKRKPQSTHQFATFLHLTEEHSQYYWPLNRVSVETPTCLPTRCSGTMADAIWPSHKAGEHLCVQEQRERERREKRGHITGQLEKRLRQKWREHWRGRPGEKTTEQDNAALYCPSNPWHPQIDPQFCFVSRQKLIHICKHTVPHRGQISSGFYKS